MKFHVKENLEKKLEIIFCRNKFKLKKERFQGDGQSKQLILSIKWSRVTSGQCDGFSKIPFNDPELWILIEEIKIKVNKKTQEKPQGFRVQNQ